MGAETVPVRSRLDGLLGRTYTVCVLGLRFLWLGLGIIHYLVMHLEMPLYSTEVLLLVVLVGETHTDYTRGIDPGPPEDVSFFERDRGIQLLFILTFLGYLILLVRLLHVHVPPTLAGPLKHIVPGSKRPLFLLFIGFLLTSGGIMGSYAHWRDPGLGGCIHRTIRNLSEFSGPVQRERYLGELEDALTGSLPPGIAFLQLGLSKLVVGCVLSVFAVLTAILTVPVLSYPQFFLVVVTGWLAYDLLGHRFRDGTSERGLISELGEEIEAPKKWLLELEILEAGLKGVITTLFLVLGGLANMLLLAGAGTAVVALVSSSMVELATILTGHVQEGGLAVFLDIPLLLPMALGLTLFMVSVTVSTLAVGVYGFAVWYLLLHRLPTWVEHYWSGELSPIESRPLPPAALTKYSVLGLGYFFLLGLISLMAERITLDAYPQTAAIVWVLAVSFTVHSWYVSRALSSALATVKRGDVRLNLRMLRLDNHRILLFVLVVFGGPVVALGKFRFGAKVVLLVTLVLMYYYADIIRFADKRVEGFLTNLLVTDAYLLLIGVGLLGAVRVVYPSLDILVWLIPIIAVLMILAAVGDYYVFHR